MNYLTLFLLFCAICAKSDDGFWWSLPSSIIVNPYNVNDYFDYSNFTAGTVSPSLTQMTNSVFPIPTNDFTGPYYNTGPPNLPVYEINGVNVSTCTNFEIIGNGYNGYTFLGYKTPVRVWGTNYYGNDGQIMMETPYVPFTTVTWGIPSYPTAITNICFRYMTTVPNGTTSAGLFDSFTVQCLQQNSPNYVDNFVWMQWNYGAATNLAQLEWDHGSTIIKTNFIVLGTTVHYGDNLECEMDVNCGKTNATFYVWDASQGYILLATNNLGPLWTNEDVTLVRFGNNEEGSLATNDYFWGLSAWKGNPIGAP